MEVARRSLVIGLCLAAGCHRAPTPTDALVAPRSAAFSLDGEIDEPIWFRAPRSGAFRDATGGPARPFSEARVAWDGDHLALALYAGDEDVEPSDAFTIVVRPANRPEFSLLVPVVGPARDARDGAPRADVALGRDLDGTLGRPDDDDEEWVTEALVPLAAAGVDPRPGATFELAIERCDVTKLPERRCGSFRAPIVLGP